MAPNHLGDRIKGFLGIEPEDKLDDSVFYDDGSFIESEPTTKEFLLQFVPTVAGVTHYLRTLFPFLGWIFHYNWTWCLGDFIAGKLRALPGPNNADKME